MGQTATKKDRRTLGCTAGVLPAARPSATGARTGAILPPPLAGILEEGVTAQVGVHAKDVVGGVAAKGAGADGQGSKHVGDAASLDGGGIVGEGAADDGCRAEYNPYASTGARGRVVGKRIVKEGQLASEDADAAAAAAAGRVAREATAGDRAGSPAEFEMAPPVLPAELPVKPLSSTSM